MVHLTLCILMEFFDPDKSNKDGIVHPYYIFCHMLAFLNYDVFLFRWIVLNIQCITSLTSLLISIAGEKLIKGNKHGTNSLKSQ